jgi:hypothetical protein
VDEVSKKFVAKKEGSKREGKERRVALQEGKGRVRGGFPAEATALRTERRQGQLLHRREKAGRGDRTLPKRDRKGGALGKMP